jgi:hypothetical protein
MCIYNQCPNDTFLFFLWSITSSLLPHLQNDNVRNQRENVVLAIANAQSRLGIPIQADPVSVLSADTYLSFSFPSHCGCNNHHFAYRFILIFVILADIILVALLFNLLL